LEHSPIWSAPKGKWVGVIVAQLGRHDFAVYDLREAKWERLTREQWVNRYIEKPPAMAPAMNPACPKQCWGIMRQLTRHQPNLVIQRPISHHMLARAMREMSPSWV
jgi:hypothetical protein